MNDSAAVSQDAFGWELILDLYNCNSKKVRSRENIRSFILQLCEILDVKRYGDPWVERFGHGQLKTFGYTVVQIIETSSIVIHFSELYNSVYLEIFSCKQFDPVKITEFCRRFFEAETVKQHLLERK